MARPDSNPAPLTNEERDLFDELTSPLEVGKGRRRLVVIGRAGAIFPKPGMASRSWRVAVAVLAVVAALVVMPMLYIGVYPALGAALVAGGLGYLIVRDIQGP